MASAISVSPKYMSSHVINVLSLSLIKKSNKLSLALVVGAGVVFAFLSMYDIYVTFVPLRVSNVAPPLAITPFFFLFCCVFVVLCSCFFVNSCVLVKKN